MLLNPFDFFSLLEYDNGLNFIQTVIYDVNKQH